MTQSVYYRELEALARQGRWLVVSTVASSGAGHIGGPLSAMDLLIALYFAVLDIRPGQPQWAGRDRFILSKGHAAIGLYTVLALRGFLPVAELRTFDKEQSRLQGHPDATRLPALDASTGSLGQGLSVGLGIALGARLRGECFQTFVMLGDGELQEGMVWEALQMAPRYRLGNLTAILDYNGLQQFGWTPGPGDSQRGDRRDPWGGIELETLFTTLGWRVLECDGHDFAQIIATLTAAKNDSSSDRPTMILARTVKGKGVRAMEGRFEWHSRIPTQRELEAAARDLDIKEAFG
jgi:transketolase